ncbi:MAG TPA: hypothetical protein VKA32_08825 [Gammaproteobacteria bacterium]|nr:hypothetical protein [Gammaproteobacteria bacterium]
MSDHSLSSPGVYWHGDGPLWHVYWLYGVLGSVVLLALLAWISRYTGVTPMAYTLGAVALAVYTVWILVSVWRCAFNVRNRTWAHVARALTLFWALNVLFLTVFLGLDVLL